MAFKVTLTAAAAADIEEAFTWLAEHSRDAAQRWYHGIMRSIDTLQQHPLRCALAPESEALEDEIRVLNFGRRSGRYRILFTVDQTRVSIVRVRHAARRFLHQEGEPDAETGE